MAFLQVTCRHRGTTPSSSLRSEGPSYKGSRAPWHRKPAFTVKPESNCCDLTSERSESALPFAAKAAEASQLLGHVPVMKEAYALEELGWTPRPPRGEGRPKLGRGMAMRPRWATPCSKSPHT